MKTILTTGTTGFLGSALVANLLAEGMRVKALSRNDPGGRRTRLAVEKAARGFGRTLTAEQQERLCVVEVDFQQLAGTLPPQVLEDVTDVWNVAADRSYSTRKIFQAVEQNVVASCMLYSLVARHARHCQRFYHVSTAYTAGFGPTQVHEQFHLTPQLINSYQLSKWLAELTLLQHHRELGLPLTLFRPSLLIGHQETGWSTGVAFGLFSLAEGLLYGKRMQAEHVQLELREDSQPNLVCVDTVVRRARELLRAEAHREPTEIFHCIGDETRPLAEVLEPAWMLLGLSAAFGPARLPVDLEINHVFERDKAFADTTWTFHADRLRRVLGDAYGAQPMSGETARRSLMYFLAHRLRELAVHLPARTAGALGSALGHAAS